VTRSGDRANGYRCAEHHDSEGECGDESSAGTALAFVRGTDGAVYVSTGTPAGFGAYRRIPADEFIDELVAMLTSAHVVPPLREH